MRPTGPELVAAAKRDIDMIANHVGLNWRQTSVSYFAEALNPE
jgi:hypothetical protein